MGQVCYLYILYLYCSYHSTNTLVSLCRQYKGLAHRLIQTGGGLQADDTGEQVIQYRVPGDGPTTETPSDAKNLWGEFPQI